jgi:hypothetical protein
MQQTPQRTARQTPLQTPQQTERLTTLPTALQPAQHTALQTPQQTERRRVLTHLPSSNNQIQHYLCRLGISGQQIEPAPSQNIAVSLWHQSDRLRGDSANNLYLSPLKSLP